MCDEDGLWCFGETTQSGGIEKWVVPARRDGSDELVMNGVDCSCCACRRVELTQDIADVAIDRSLTQAQLTGNLFVRMTA